jgi:hypothetical protein
LVHPRGAPDRRMLRNKSYPNVISSIYIGFHIRYFYTCAPTCIFSPLDGLCTTFWVVDVGLDGRGRNILDMRLAYRW